MIAGVGQRHARRAWPSRLAGEFFSSVDDVLAGQETAPAGVGPQAAVARAGLRRRGGCAGRAGQSMSRRAGVPAGGPDGQAFLRGILIGGAAAALAGVAVGACCGRRPADADGGAYPHRHRHRRHVHRRRRVRRGHRGTDGHQDAVDARRPGAGLHDRAGEGARPARGRAWTRSRRSATAPRSRRTSCWRATVGELGFITSEGFEFILEIARQSVPDGYGNSYFWVKPDRIVPPDLVKTVGGRMDHTGAEMRPFDEAQAVEVARWFAVTAASTRSACASCTPTPTPSTRSGWRPCWPASIRRRRGVAVVAGAA